MGLLNTIRYCTKADAETGGAESVVFRSVVYIFVYEFVACVDPLSHPLARPQVRFSKLLPPN